MPELTSGEKTFYAWWVGVVVTMIVVIVVMSVSWSVPQ